MKKLLSYMVENDAELNMILADAHRQLIFHGRNDDAGQRH